MRSQPVVLSLFPGIGLLDMAFEREGFCVVRGPDVLWGGDVKVFHPPAGVFAGIIGGPPCQAFSPLAHLVRATWGESSIAENLIPEFERVVTEAAPVWFVMENARQSPLPSVAGYSVYSQLLNNRWLGEPQNRLRRISFGTLDGRRLHIQTDLFETAQFELTVTSGSRERPVSIGGSGKPKPGVNCGPNGMRGGPRRSLAAMLELQGFPGELLDHVPFTVEAKRKMIGNGVPLPMGRAIARAVKRALYPDLEVVA